MSKEHRLDKLALLFEEVVELGTPEERSIFLNRACGGDRELREEVERLLQVHLAAGTFLRTDPGMHPGPTGRGEGEHTAELKPGDWLGPYHLLGLVGEGGSSTVYLAEQEKPVRRWVALKVIKAGMDTQQIIARFELERQALAVMDHPGIAKVLDAGATPSGRPFFVMELVRGLEITRHCDQHRLSIRQRLELFIEVCHAVLHAHQKGIVHRDIKPDNIMVCLHDGKPFPKIIDFGIAKVLHTWNDDSTPGTGGLPFLGTPAYMSPEQAQVTMPDLDTRTDIYSLGALLYELLMGHPPFDHVQLMTAGLEQMCHIIRTEEPPGLPVRFAELPADEQQAIAQARQTTPEELGRALTGDLEWIALKALAKNREERYETAANLADDIERHLQNLPVSAAAPTVRYRLSKMVRRNRKAVMTAAAVTLVLVGSAILNFGMAVHARSSAKRELEMRSAAEVAERNSHKALLAMHASSAISATDEKNYDRAVLWFANAARAAGKNDPSYALNLQRVMSWLDRTPMPVGAFQLSGAFQVLEFCRGSKYLLAVDREGCCRLWDCTRQVPLDWACTLGPVVTAAWDPVEARLALAFRDRKVQLRSLPDGGVLRTIAWNEDVHALGFTPDGRHLLFGSRVIRAFHVPTGQLLEKCWTHPTNVVGFGFSAQSDRVVSICLDGSARILSLGEEPGPADPLKFEHRPSIRVDSCSSKTTYRQDFLELPVLSLPALAGDGRLLVTRTGTYQGSVWDLESGQRLHLLDEMCCSCRFVMSQDGTKLAGGLHGGRIGVWEIASGRQLALLSSSGACNLDVAFGPKGERLLTAEANGVSRLWSIPEKRQVSSAMHHSAEVDKVAFACNEELVATAQVDGLVRVWALPRPGWQQHRIVSVAGPKVVRMDPERCHFVMAREPAWKAVIRSATVYSVQTGQPVGPSFELDGNLEDVALSPQHRVAAVAYGLGNDDQEGVLEFREIVTGAVTSKTRLASAASSLSWDPKGERVAAICHSGQLIIVAPGSDAPRVWAQATESASRRIHPFVAFAPDGNSLVCLTPAGAIEVRDTANGLLRYPALRADPGGFWHFATSRDSERLATTTRSGQVDIWNIQTGEHQGSPLYHPACVYSCNFSPDGTLLVTAGHDARSRIWDLRTGKQKGSSQVHPNEVYDAVFTPDGLSILTACRDGAVRAWDCESGQLLAPRFRVGDQAFTVEIAADGQHAVIGSLDSSIHVLALERLRQTVAAGPDELCLLAEVVSGSVVTQGSIRDLTTTEWLQKVRELRRTSPSLIRTGWVPTAPAEARPAQVAAGQEMEAPGGCPSAGNCASVSCPNAAKSAAAR